MCIYTRSIPLHTILITAASIQRSSFISILDIFSLFRRSHTQPNTTHKQTKQQ